jgi:hypothetical protein
MVEVNIKVKMVEADGSNYTILVAEDEEFSRHNLIMSLNFCKFNLVAVEDGK